MDDFQQRLEKAKVEQDLSYFTTGEGKNASVWFNSGKQTRLVDSFQKSPELRKFWYSQDCTPETLVNRVSKSTLVAIDVGNHQSEAAVDVGIAILPTFPTPDIPLEEGVASLSECGAYIHNFCTPTQGIRDFEPLRFGSEETLEADKVEEKLVKILQQTKREADKLGNKLALILFGAGGDLRTISRLFPKIVPLFAWWTDIQAIATKITIPTTVGGTDENTPRRRTSYSLGEILVALGHKALCHGGTSKRLPKHKSSHDAARTLVVAVGIARKLGAGEKLTVQEHMKTQTRRKIWNRRPQPARLYPFVANIKMEDTGRCPTPREYRCCGPEDLWDVFAAYEPVAVGRRICRARSNWADWFGGCEGRCGACIWVAVPTGALVGQLVRDFHGKEMRDGRLVVKDTSLPVDEGGQDGGGQDGGDLDEGNLDEWNQDEGDQDGGDQGEGDRGEGDQDE